MEKNHAFREEVLGLTEATQNLSAHFRYSSPSEEDNRDQCHHSSGLFTKEFLAKFITTETEVYFCGPKPMMKHIYQALNELQHPKEKVHYEFFGPQEDLED